MCFTRKKLTYIIFTLLISLINISDSISLQRNRISEFFPIFLPSNDAVKLSIIFKFNTSSAIFLSQCSYLHFGAKR